MRNLQNLLKKFKVCIRHICLFLTFSAQARSLERKVPKLRAMFVTSTDSPQIAFENDPEDEREEFAKTSFLNLVSRGKLMMPSPLVYEAGMQCLRLHSEIFDNSELV